MTPGRAYWAWGEYLNPHLDGNEALKELVFFLLDRRAASTCTIASGGSLHQGMTLCGIGSKSSAAWPRTDVT